MLDREWLATFAPLGRILDGGRFQPTAATVFLVHEDTVWMATARHATEPDDARLGVVVTVDGTPTLLDITAALASRPGLGWVVASEHDVAIAPMPTPRRALPSRRLIRRGSCRSRRCFQRCPP